MARSRALSSLPIVWSCPHPSGRGAWPLEPRSLSRASVLLRVRDSPQPAQIDDPDAHPTGLDEASRHERAKHSKHDLPRGAELGRDAALAHAVRVVGARLTDEIARYPLFQ